MFSVFMVTLALCVSKWLQPKAFLTLFTRKWGDRVRSYCYSHCSQTDFYNTSIAKQTFLMADTQYISLRSDLKKRSVILYWVLMDGCGFIGPLTFILQVWVMGALDDSNWKSVRKPLILAWTSAVLCIPTWCSPVRSFVRSMAGFGSIGRKILPVHLIDQKRSNGVPYTRLELCKRLVPNTQ